MGISYLSNAVSTTFYRRFVTVESANGSTRLALMVRFGDTNGALYIVYNCVFFFAVQRFSVSLRDTVLACTAMRVTINNDRRSTVSERRPSGTNGRSPFTHTGLPVQESRPQCPGVRFSLIASVGRVSSKARHTLFADSDGNIDTWADAYTVDSCC